MALPTSLKRRLLAVLAGYRAAKGGLIRDWEALLARHAGDLDAETGAEGRFAAMLAKDTRPDSAREPVWLDQFLASVGTVERAFLEDPAPGFESLAPLSQIAGTRLGLPTSLHPGHTPEAFRGPGAALIQRAQHLAVVPLVDCPAGPLKVARLAGPIRIGRDPLMEPDRAYKHGKVRVENPDGTWLFEPLVRPIWAEAIWKDANGLFARVPEFQLAYQEAGPGLSWRSDDANGKEPSPEGRWVVLTKPAWAKAAGIDRFGLWADFCLEASDHSSAISGATLGFSHRLRYLPPGTFTLGSPEAEAGRNADETEQVVSLSQGFWLGETACTQNMLIAVLGENPSHFRASLNNPADGVNWYQTQTFLLKLNASLPGLNFTLPTEAQWEYACRAGTIGPYSFPGKADPTKVNFGSLWHEDHYLKGQLRGKPALIWGDPTQAGVSGMGTTVAVRSLPPNPWGLYEMHGNVWEWCKDAQRPFTKPPAGPPEDPGGSAIDQRIVLRGGCWAADSNRCRSASRAVQHPAAAFNGIGFRLSRPAPALPNEAGEQVWDGPPPSRARSSRNSPEPEPRP
jgi:formylglycine-generating enzyme required for sulfatase activity